MVEVQYYMTRHMQCVLNISHKTSVAAENIPERRVWVVVWDTTGFNLRYCFHCGTFLFSSSTTLTNPYLNSELCLSADKKGPLKSFAGMLGRHFALS